MGNRKSPQGLLKMTKFMKQFIKYVKSTTVELKQVSWPSQRQAIMYTALVVGISAVVALYVGAFDYVFSQFINSLINAF